MVRVRALAATNGLKRHEVPGLLSELEKIGAVQVSETGIAVLGITQANLFKQASALFEEQEPTKIDMAAIELAEMASHAPVAQDEVSEELSDTFRLSINETIDLFDLSKKIGFVDYEQLGEQLLLFNGSLFKRDGISKAKTILDALTADERQNLLDADSKLDSMGCLPEEIVQRILGPSLWHRLHQIGYFQVSTVTNERGSTKFVTKPSALVKYVPGGLGDMHDDAKALASSLTYGILKSDPVRGKIMTPDKLIGAMLSRGYVEGWAKAIIQDYQVLERKGVVETSKTDRGYRLTLNKPEVGQMARDLILKGDATEASAAAVVGHQPVTFAGPEAARTAERLKEVPETWRSSSLALATLRKTR
jgi:hypothetical protein